ncbi:MAG: hypothetical protein H6Q73_3809 [Firmicutes bacterium]|nr:hypothetical protein [Bacillota bacterium]
MHGFNERDFANATITVLGFIALVLMVVFSE